jgi:hypothetical protein
MRESLAMAGTCTRFDVRLTARLGALLLAGLAIGCSRGTGNVSGTVKFNGKPLTDGTVIFYDQDNRVRSSKITAEGTYSVTEVRTGMAKITVAVPLPIVFVGPGSTTPAPKAPPVPARYADSERSGLTLDVVRGDQTHPIELEP